MHCNSFHFARFAAASAVLYGHHWAIHPAPIGEPFLGFDWSGIAVWVFFAMSGFLIFQSLERSPDWANFFAARLTRLLPALVVVASITSVGALVAYGNYANIADHIVYVLRNTFMFVADVQYGIDGIWRDHPYTAINGSMWTLPHEFWCYFALFLIVALARRTVMALVIALVVAASMWMSGISGEIPMFGAGFRIVDGGKLATWFFAGALTAAFWPWLLERRRVALGMALVVSIGGAWLIGPLNPIFAAAATVVLIFACHAHLLADFSRWGDPSYGIYLFAWPAAQTMTEIFAGFYESMAAALVVTIAAGYASWHLVEKHAIANRHRIAGWMRRRSKDRGLTA